MKKIIALLLVLSTLLTVTGCDAILEKFGQQTEPPHTHEFVIVEEESKAPTCKKEGLEVKVCACGERQETVLAVLEHNFEQVTFNLPHCTKSVSNGYKCTLCKERKSETIPAIGHNYEEAATEPSRVIRCLNEGCSSCKWGVYENKYAEELTFNFTDEDKAAIDAKYEEVLAMIEAAAKYDPALHGYAEEGELADAFAIVDAAHTELYNLVENVISQKQLAEIAYYCDMKNKDLEETHKAMMDYQTAVIAQFYTLSQPFYDSCYRDFYYYGMTEEEIKAFLFDSNTVSSPEYTALKERNDAIEAEFVALSASEQRARIAELYAEFADNNNKMAQLMGYENYLEYAYENVYGRDYTYEEATQFSAYVKEYISTTFSNVYSKWGSLTGSSSLTQAEIDEYYLHVSDSFFGRVAGNAAVNDYIDLLAFTSNPDKNITFSDEFNKLMSDGNMFRGEYEGAFVTTIYSAKLPIAYFGKGYDNPFTIVHEFGHYMNEVYSADVAEENNEFSQSYDLLEMHSQGNELLYLCYLKENADLSETGLALIETYTLVNMLYSVMAGMTIDTFEQAIYLGEYTGTDSETIMADGVISADEYSALYTSICKDYGVEGIIDGYWEYGMTIKSPCYYISYSVSALTVLQVYEMASSQSFDAAKDAYLKLFTYVDEDPEMTLEEILAYAGMLSFKNETLYKNISKCIS